MAPRNGWNSYQKLVLSKLDEHGEHLDALAREVAEIRNTDLTDLKVEIAMLKIKAGAWGAAAGLLPALLTMGMVWFKEK